MVLIHSHYQDQINRILRPFKTRFGKAKCDFPRARMVNAGRKQLRFYRPQQGINYETYYDFDSESMKKNFRVPSSSKRIRVTDLSGEILTRVPRRFDRKHKIRYVRYSLIEQKRMGFEMLDIVYDLLSLHRRKSEGEKLTIQTPNYVIPCRFRGDFQAGNFSRFPEIWLILLSKYEKYNFA